MRLSEELELALLLERRRNEFDLEWVKGVRKGWQQLYKQRKSYPGRVEKSKHKDVSPKRDDKIVRDAAKSAKVYLGRVFKFVELLQEDLYINKGFWHVPRKIPKGQANPFEREKNQIGRALKKIQEDFYYYINIDNYGYVDSVPTWKFHPAYNFKDIEGMNGVLRTLNNNVSERLEKINNQLNRGVWKVLNGIIKEISSDKPGLGKDADSSLSISAGYEPTELNIGRARVIFRDTPLDVIKGSKRGKDYISPKMRASFVGEMKKAWALLKKRKLDSVWYGDVNVYAPSSTYTFVAGGKKRTAGANYSPTNDMVNMFVSREADVIIHELGHRYYYKIMNAKDRERFDKWYGEVKATSEYGSTSTVEDFAEVFMEYVLGKMNLDRDQVARFEAAIGVKPRVDEPKLSGGFSGSRGSVVIGGLYGKHDKEGPRVAFEGFGDNVVWYDWNALFDPIRDIDRGNYELVKRLFRRGITVRNVSSPDGAVVAEPEGVLVFNTTGKDGWLRSSRILEKIGRAYYNSEFVTPEMRNAWSDLWVFRSKADKTIIEYKYSINFRKMVNGSAINDEKVMEYMYWTFGMLEKPEWVREQQKKSVEVETPAEKKLGFKLLSPKQLYKKHGIDYPGVEWKKGRSSTAIMEALCD